MRAFVLTALLCICLVSLSSAQAPEVLTNDAVVRLVKSGLGSSLIVKMIQDEQSNFSLSSASMIRLKQQGVPEPIIAAMLAKRDNPPSAPANARPGPKSRQSAAANYTWQLNDQIDAMSGRRDFSALLSTPAISREGVREGEYEVTARCNAGTATLKIVFLPENNSGVGFKQNTETYLITQGGILGSMQFESHHKKAWTETRVRFDEEQPFIVTSEQDFLNESEVYFLAQRPRDPANILDAFGMAMDSVGPNKPAGLEQHLFGANRILLESTLDNGVKSILEIHPQDSTFQQFAGAVKI